MTEKQVDWQRADLVYQKLYYLELSISQAIREKDMESWYLLLEEEYRFVWYNGVEDHAAKGGYDLHWWESQWATIRRYLYNPRMDRDTLQTDRLVMRNMSKVRDNLHTLNMMLNKFEVETGLRITMTEKKEHGANRFEV